MEYPSFKIIRKQTRVSWQYNLFNLESPWPTIHPFFFDCSWQGNGTPGERVINKVRTKSSVSLQVNQPLLVVFLLLIGAREDSNLKFVFILKQAAHLQKPKKYIKEIHKLFSFTRQSEYIYFSRNMLKTLNPYATKQIMHCIWQSLAHWLKISGWKKKKKQYHSSKKVKKSLELSHY